MNVSPLVQREQAYWVPASLQDHPVFSHVSDTLQCVLRRRLLLSDKRVIGQSGHFWAGVKQCQTPSGQDEGPFHSSWWPLVAF